MATARIAFIDYVKAFSIIAVVFTHCQFTELQRTHILFTLVINMAVPLFMIITGYNYAKSNFIQNCGLLFNINDVISTIKKILRITLPYSIIFLLEYFACTMNQHSIFTYFINGGIGPGSYYFPVMLQIILIFPFIYRIILKYNIKGLLGLFLLEFFCIFLFVKFNLNLGTYRILCIRYISLVSIGTYMALNYEKINIKKMYMMFICGLFVILCLIYGNSQYCCYPYIKEYWSNNAGLPLVLYIFPLFYLLFNYYADKKIKNWGGNALQIIGKASWHIMLFQMFYYTAVPFVNKNNLYIDIILNLLICISVGTLFYALDTKFISGKLISRLK